MRRKKFIPACLAWAGVDIAVKPLPLAGTNRIRSQGSVLSAKAPLAGRYPIGTNQELQPLKCPQLARFDFDAKRFTGIGQSQA
jgi:hypothetical protein